MRKDVAEKLIKQILPMIETANPADWICPFVSLRPVSVSTGKPYIGGVNNFLLSLLQVQKGYTSPVWGTANAWKKKGEEKKLPPVLIKKGEKASYVMWFKYVHITEQKEKDGEIVNVTFPVFTGGAYPVFNQCQTTAADVDPAVFVKSAGGGQEATPDEKVEETLKAMPDPPQRKPSSQGAFYNVAEDTVYIPTLWKTPQEWAMTVLHEYAHATGHEKRLDRKFGKNGNYDYAMEEVVAELAAAMIAQHLQIPFDAGQAMTYGACWAKKMAELKGALDDLQARGDFERDLLNAAMKGWKAARYILNISYDGDETE